MLIKVIVLVVMYSVGICGIFWYDKDFVLGLTPITLLVSSVLVLPSKKNATFFSMATVIILLGLCIEMVGVATSIPFGAYNYGNNLGPKWGEVPLIIGINWWLLAYISWVLVYPFFTSRLARVASAGVLMLAVDLLMEQVAYKLDFWYWSSQIIPLENYLAWCCIGMFFCLLLDRFTTYEKNKVARAMYFIQVAFFGVLVLFLN